MQPAELLNDFVDGRSWQTAAGWAVALNVCRLGALYLPSGRLVARDPAIHDDLPFEQAFPPGEYPVDIVVARIRKPQTWLRALWPRAGQPAEDRRVALAALVVHDAAPARWERARIASQARQAGPVSYSYSVDSACGSFMDQRAARLARDNRLELFEDLDLVAENPPDQPMWANLRFRQAEPLNIMIFSSGWGDGSYSSYIGYADHGGVTRVVTDFEVLKGALIK